MKIKSITKIDYEKAYGILCHSAATSGQRAGIYPTLCKILPRGQTLAHAHFEPELFILIRGQGIMSINDEVQSVGAGDLVEIPSFSTHQLKNTSDETLEFLSVYSEDFSVPALPDQVLLTAAPPTPNGPLHLGHISGPYLGVDVMQRYLRSQSVCVISHSGTDDNQNYVSEKARSLNRTTTELQAQMRTRIVNGLDTLNIRFDDFTEPISDRDYQLAVQNFAMRATMANVIQQDTLPLPYCNACDHVLIDALAAGTCPSCQSPSHGACESCGIVSLPSELLNTQCARCGATPDVKLIDVYTFNLSQYLPLIIDDLSALSLSPRLRRLVDNVSSKPMTKVLVSYPSKNNDGIGLPESSQILHVWFEMAAHYERFATQNATWIHSFGFDNSFYYLLFIPALLKALNPQARLPAAVITNEFLLLNGSKFSTSRGHAIWADEFRGNIDHLRLYLCYLRPDQQTSDFVMDEFLRFSQNLEKQISQVMSRAALIAETYIPTVSNKAIVQTERFKKDFERYMSIECFDLRQASRHILAFLDLTTQSLGTYGDDQIRIKTLALALAAFMPKTSNDLLQIIETKQLGLTKDIIANDVLNEVSYGRS